MHSYHAPNMVLMFFSFSFHFFLIICFTHTLLTGTAATTQEKPKPTYHSFRCLELYSYAHRASPTCLVRPRVPQVQTQPTLPSPPPPRPPPRCLLCSTISDSRAAERPPAWLLPSEAMPSRISTYHAKSFWPPRSTTSQSSRWEESSWFHSSCSRDRRTCPYVGRLGPCT